MGQKVLFSNFEPPMKIVKYVILIGLMSQLHAVKAGKIDKAFEALSRYDYFGAKELFEKLKDKEPVAAPYGLSLIFGRDDNPFYNVDSAYAYITLAEKRFPPEELGDLEDLREIGINDSVLSNWKDSVDYFAWQIAQETNTLKAYQNFIDKHLDSEQLPLAIAERNRLVFAEAKELNTARAYRLFLEKHPDSEQANEAEALYQKSLYQEYTEGNQISDYVTFCKLFPESPYLREAQDSIYLKSVKQRDIAAFEAFIQDHPNNPNVNLAWRSIYKLFTADYSPQRIVDFRIKYPDYPFNEELRTDMKLAAKVFFPFKEDALYGFMDEAGEVMIEAEYEVVEPFTEGLSLAIRNGKLGFIDKSGAVTIDFQYEDGEPFQAGKAIVSKDGKYGMIDRNNKTVIPLIYELVGAYQNGLALIANDTAYGFLDVRGQLRIPLELDYANDFENHYALVEIDGKKGIIDTNGRQIVQAKYSYLENFNAYGVARAKNDSAYGLVDQNGKELLPLIYDHIGEFGDSLAMIVQGDQYGYVNARGEVIIPLQFNYSTEALVWGVFQSGFVKCKEEDKYGIIDREGREIYPSIFEDVGDYSGDQLIAVKKRGKWGYADQEVKLQLPYKYLLARTFKNGKGKIKTEKGWQFIDEKGEFLLDSAAMEARYLDTFIVVSWHGSFMLLDQELKPVINESFDGIRNYAYHYLQMKQGEKFFYFDPKLRKMIGLKEE